MPGERDLSREELQRQAHETAVADASARAVEDTKPLVALVEERLRQYLAKSAPADDLTPEQALDAGVKLSRMRRENVIADGVLRGLGAGAPAGSPLTYEQLLTKLEQAGDVK